jgi:SH3 domain protein
MSVRLLVIAWPLLLASVAHAETRYVSDRTIVELRRGPSIEYLILRNLEAGEAVEVLEQDGDAGYSRVRVRDQGTEGWILTRYLTAQPIARDRLAAAETELQQARARVGELEQQVADLNGRLSSAQSDLEVTRSTHGEVSKELADIRTAAANVIEIREQNESLQQRLAQSDAQVQRLTLENQALAGRNNQNWFLIGAGVLFGGILLGLIAPSLRKKRRSDW